MLPNDGAEIFIKRVLFWFLLLKRMAGILKGLAETRGLAGTICKRERTRLLKTRTTVFPHGDPERDPNAVYKERVTCFEISGLGLNPTEWTDVSVDLDPDSGAMQITGQPGDGKLCLSVLFSNTPAPEIRVSSRESALVTPEGCVCISFSLWGSSQSDLRMTLRLTDPAELVLAEREFLVRAKVTTASIRYVRRGTSRRRCRRADARDDGDARSDGSDGNDGGNDGNDDFEMFSRRLWTARQTCANRRYSLRNCIRRAEGDADQTVLPASPCSLETHGSPAGSHTSLAVPNTQNGFVHQDLVHQDLVYQDLVDRNLAHRDLAQHGPVQQDFMQDLTSGFAAHSDAASFPLLFETAQDVFGWCFPNNGIDAVADDSQILLQAMEDLGGTAGDLAFFTQQQS